MRRDTTSRGLYVRVWPPHTSERRGGGGGCEQEGWQGGEGRARMSGQEELQRHTDDPSTRMLRLIRRIAAVSSHGLWRLPRPSL